MDPVKELAARQAKAISNAAERRASHEADEAREDGAPPPGKPKPGGTAAASVAESTKAPVSEKPTGDSTTKEGETKAEPARELKYDLKSLRKWAEKNPEEAAEAAKVIFKAPADDDWIKLTNKTRKLKDRLEKQAADGLSAAEAKLQEAEAKSALLESAADKLQPIADLFSATAERIAQGQPPDFEATDEAFRMNAGVTIDEYMRLRARRGVISPEAAKMRAENLRLKKELESAKKAVPEAPKAEDKPEPKAAVVNSTAPDWGDEIPKKHGLRRIEGWKDLLSTEMAKHHDETLDEYSADPEEMADKVLKRELKRLQGEDEEEPVKSKVKVKVRKPSEQPEEKPSPRKGKAPADAPQFSRSDITGEDEADDEAPLIGKSWSATVAKALKRAQERARSGEFD